MALNRKQLEQFVEQQLQAFHQRRLESLQSLNLRQILKRKNPYLFRAKNITTAHDLVKAILDAHLSSQEETLFGHVLEEIAVYVAGEVYGGKKSSAEGIDIEIQKDGVLYIVSVKSGPNWGNSSQIARMRNNFKQAARRLRQSRSVRNVIAVNGCCYGRDNRPDKGDYLKLCGQRFWEFVSGDPNLYVDLIQPIGRQAKQKNENFVKAYGGVLNKLERDFLADFVDAQGHISWDKLLQFNSGK